ncbi:MAG: hypothetical protein ACOY99_04195 [Pseudomonadota bacterium]
MPENPGKDLEDKISEDLAFVRAALDRQRRTLSSFVPVWFAALIGVFFIGSTLLADLDARALVTATFRDWYKTIALAVLVIGLSSRAYARRGAGSDCAAARLPWRARAVIVLPWIAFGAGILMVQRVGVAAGLAEEVVRPFLLTQAALAMVLIGLGGLGIFLGFGLGLALGTLSLVYANLAYPYTALGVLVAAGLVLGAWADHRAIAGRQDK